jgi:hypothetical protein
MDKSKPSSANGKERRSGTDRRKGERRDPERSAETGALSTRKTADPDGRKIASTKVASTKVAGTKVLTSPSPQT